VEFDAAVLSETQHGRAAGSVSAGGEYADRRQAFLQLEAYPGAGKLRVRRALGVVKELEGRAGVEGWILQLLCEPRLGPFDLGP
jgi:hypothetical protein